MSLPSPVRLLVMFLNTSDCAMFTRFPCPALPCPALPSALPCPALPALPALPPARCSLPSALCPTLNNTVFCNPHFFCTFSAVQNNICKISALFLQPTAQPNPHFFCTFSAKISLLKYSPCPKQIVITLNGRLWEVRRPKGPSFRVVILTILSFKITTLGPPCPSEALFSYRDRFGIRALADVMVDLC